MKRRRRAAPGASPGAAAGERSENPSYSAPAREGNPDTGWNTLITAARAAGWSVGCTLRGGAVFSRSGSTVYGPTADAAPEAVNEVRERLQHADRLAARWRP